MAAQGTARQEWTRALSRGYRILGAVGAVLLLIGCAAIAFVVNWNGSHSPDTPYWGMIQEICGITGGIGLPFGLVGTVMTAFEWYTTPKTGAVVTKGRN